MRSVGIGCSHIHSHICNLDDLAMMSARDEIRGLRSNRTHTKRVFWTAASCTKSVLPICEESAGKFAIHHYWFSQQHLFCPLFSPWTSGHDLLNSIFMHFARSQTDPRKEAALFIPCLRKFSNSNIVLFRILWPIFTLDHINDLDRVWHRPRGVPYGHHGHNPSIFSHRSDDIKSPRLSQPLW